MISTPQSKPARAVRGRGAVVNDIHSELNPTRVAQVVEARSRDEVTAAIEHASRVGLSVSVAGGRHSMGGQQFGAGTLLIDMTPLNRILDFDPRGGRIEVEAGIRWPDLVRGYLELQGRDPRWGIAQKQTGADRLSIGGALGANAHGRGLAMKPLVADIESIVLADASGTIRRSSRAEDPELFALAIGGYGLLGIVLSATLKLAPRRMLERVVEIALVDDLIEAFESRIAAGFLYGDFQFAIDERSDDFLRRGVFSSYRPIDPRSPVLEGQRELTEADWRELIYLAHTDKTEGFRRYEEHYLSTSGQIYWSDTHQLGVYLERYHRELDAKLERGSRASEVITEIFVPRHELKEFLAEAREDFRRNGVNLIYGTVRLIERDEETFLAWARERWTCVVFNLHTEHTFTGRRRSAEAFRRLIDMAIRRGGSFFLPYHRHATREQVEACHPRFREFLRRKRQRDPEERFQSDWYRHYRRLFAQT
jgi:FAD/FMN-containing dehydrogenase